MKHKEQLGQMTADIFILYGALLLLSFICRIWPVILLAILGLFAVMIRMLFLSLSNKNNYEEADIIISDDSIQQTTYTKGELELAVFHDFEDQVTEFVLSHWKDATWVFEKSDVHNRIFTGGDVYILLNNAGGYRRARVIYQGLKVYGLKYGDVHDYTDMGEAPDDIGVAEIPIVNYSMIAFEWCDAHLSEINAQCEKAFEKDLKEVLIPVEELPVPESFEDICKEILRRLDREAQIMTDGILIIL